MKTFPSSLARWTLTVLLPCCATVDEPVVVDAGAAAAAAISPTLQEDQRVLKRKVAVLRFSNETKYGTGAFGGAYGVPIEKQAADILKARLVESGKVILIDEEGLTGEGADLTKINADFAIIGSVSEFGRKTTSETGVFSRSKKQVAYAAVNLRLIDTRTGKAIYAEEGAGESEVETGRVLGVGEDAGYDSTLNDRAISSAISKLVSNVIGNMMDAPWQTGILAVEGEDVTIAGGDRQGLRVGDELIVKKRGKLVEDPQYGGRIELPRTEVARIRVQAFFGSGVDGQGSVCRLLEGSIEEHDVKDLVVEEKQ